MSCFPSFHNQQTCSTHSESRVSRCSIAMDTELDSRVSAAATAYGSESSSADPCTITAVGDSSIPPSSSMDSPGSVAAASLPDTTAVPQSTQRPSTWRTRLTRAAGFCFKVAITLQLIASACDLLPFGGLEQRDGNRQAGSFNKQHSNRSKSSSRSRESGSSSKNDSHMDNEELLSTVGRVVLFLSGDLQDGAEELLQIGTAKVQAALEIIDTEVLEVMQVEDAKQVKQDIATMLALIRKEQRKVEAEEGQRYSRAKAADNNPSSSSEELVVKQ